VTPDESGLHDDPIGMLAEAAGYTDHELWWEHQIEQRQDAEGLFEGILEAMSALRASSRQARETAAPRTLEALREAHMRQTIRAAERDGLTRIAVVCGAWHAPAVAVLGPADEDSTLLARLPRARVTATWIPWTNGRLSYRSGYGAGIYAPGWYEHLWTVQDRHAVRWIARIAHLLRDEDLDASPASVIETVRLAEALAAMRDLPLPGLAELHEAAQAVLCRGDPTPMALIRTRLEIGERLGAVPAETPAVPLQQDLAAAQRRLRLKPSAEESVLDLDLRNETDCARSHLLHRLNLLDIPWGRPERAGKVKGTFHELWRLKWEAGFAVAVIEANVWGNTLESAAVACACGLGDAAHELLPLTTLLDAAILAALPTAVDYLLTLVQRQAAVAADVRRLMEALPVLARVARYGDVRGTAGTAGGPVIDALFERVVVGLPGACSALDDDAAAQVVDGMGQVQQAVALLDRGEQRTEWHGVLRLLLDHAGVHGLVRGWACRLLLEAEALDGSGLQRLAGLALSPVLPAAQAAAWLEGVLRGSGFILMQQDALWRALDEWLSALSAATFAQMLPLVRRAFSGFPPPERRAIGEKVKTIRETRAPAGGQGMAMHAGGPIDRERAALVLPVLAQVLGVRHDGHR
jgi:hypothetical protein